MEDLQGGTLALEHRYDVVRRHGRQGLATIYQGVQEPFGKKVWVSAYDDLAQMRADTSLIDRLKQAAQTASRLSAGGILRVIDYGELSERVPFVISERVDAPTLADLLNDEGTLSPQVTGELVARLAAILTPAHRAGIAHGSVSPRWIFVADGDLSAASLGHFQLAATLPEILRSDDVVMSCEAISAFPPEIFEAIGDQDDDHDAHHSIPFTVAGDVWALGVIAYTALVGVHPFFEDGLDAHEAIARLRTHDPRPLDELGVDAQISDAITRALHRDPAQRFASVADLSDALTSAVGMPVGTPSRLADGVELDEGFSDEGDSARGSLVADAHSPVAPAGIPTAPAQEREPGPSDRLLTVAIVVLILSNLAWLYYATSARGDLGATLTPQNKSAPASIVTHDR